MPLLNTIQENDKWPQLIALTQYSTVGTWSDFYIFKVHLATDCLLVQSFHSDSLWLCYAITVLYLYPLLLLLLY